MKMDKESLLTHIKKALSGKVSEYYIFGSFATDSWKHGSSDIDIACVDQSFKKYFHFENLKYIEQLLSIKPYKYHIFVYTPRQFIFKKMFYPQFRRKMKDAICFKNHID